VVRSINRKAPGRRAANGWSASDDHVFYGFGNGLKAIARYPHLLGWQATLINQA
jgi:hypothetical protein